MNHPIDTPKSNPHVWGLSTPKDLKIHPPSPEKRGRPKFLWTRGHPVHVQNFNVACFVAFPLKTGDTDRVIAK